MTVFVILVIIVRSLKGQELRTCLHSCLLAIQILSRLVQYKLSNIVERLKTEPQCIRKDDLVFIFLMLIRKEL